jgi:antitoxin ParD1/3/4
METIHVALPDELNRFVAAQVVAGGYETASDYPCALVAKARSGQGRLETLLMEGLESGAPIALDDREWAVMRRKVDVVWRS